MAQATRHGRSLAVMFLDLDDFKTINDSYGHAMGDAVLQMIAGRLKETIRGDDTIGRYGGDEFLCVLTEVRNETDYRLDRGKDHRGDSSALSRQCRQRQHQRAHQRQYWNRHLPEGRHHGGCPDQECGHGDVPGETGSSSADTQNRRLIDAAQHRQNTVCVPAERS